MDWDRITMLLNVCGMTLGYPQLRKIHDTAFAELLALQDPLKAEPDAQAKLEFNHEFRRR